jgi:Zn-finger nucleic acid-binding protein
MARKCPRCQVKLTILNVRDIELDACPKCMGIWFDSTELDKVIGGAKSFEEMAYLSQPLGGKIFCPNCGDKMHYSTLKDVTIDFCKKCEGVWLDTGELSELAGHLPEPNITAANAPYDIEIKESDGFIAKVKNILTRK